MTKVALLSDLHAHNHSEHAKTLRPGVTDRLLDCTTILGDARDACLERKVHHLLFLGDLFHKRGTISVAAYDLVVRELVQFRQRGIRVFMMVGNHDQVDRGELDAVQALEVGNLVQTINPHLDCQHWKVEDASILAYSYCDDPDLLQKRLDRSRRLYGDAQLGAFHHGFKGARVGSYLEYEVEEPVEASTLRGRFKAVVSGHYHQRQPIRGLENAMYVGSPLQHTRSDRTEEPKGMLIYDFAADDIELVPFTRPEFVTLDCRDTAKLDFTKGNFVDVLYAEEHAGGPKKLARQLEEVGVRGVYYVPPPPKEVESSRFSVDPRTSPKKVLRAVLEARRDTLERLDLDAKQVFEESYGYVKAATEE